MVSFITESIHFISKHKHDILLVTLGITIFVILRTKHLLNLEPEDVNPNKRVTKEIIIETMDVKEKEKSEKHKKIIDNMTSDFCKTLHGKSHEIEEKCKIQTDGACKVRSCCVLAMKKEKERHCLAGSITGTTHHTDDNGNDINFDYYYYKNKCYGNGCPKQ